MLKTMPYFIKCDYCLYACWVNYNLHENEDYHIFLATAGDEILGSVK